MGTVGMRIGEDAWDGACTVSVFMNVRTELYWLIF